MLWDYQRETEQADKVCESGKSLVSLAGSYMILDKCVKLSGPQFLTYTVKNITSTSRGVMREIELNMLKMLCLKKNLSQLF